MNTLFPWPIPQDLADFYDTLATRLNHAQVNVITAQLEASPEGLAEFHFTLANSLYAQETVLSKPELLLALLEEQALFDAEASGKYQNALEQLPTESTEALDRTLRDFRAKAMLRIIWRALNQTADLRETTEDLSALARAGIRRALDHHYTLLSQKYGNPINGEGVVQPFLVLGMGKLGARELNLSSDIDLIFTFPESGHTDSPTNSISNQTFFSHLGKKIIHSLDNTTADGFVFRVDMRLRPYGQSGSLVYSFNALEEYYQNQGREWERYAMVKADVVASNGDEQYSRSLMTMLKRFTYRKYIDFSVIEALRNLKQMISQEVKRRRLNDDIKLGAGGIREIEFIAQVFQLIRGGRDKQLQDNAISTIMPLLVELNCLPQATVDALREAYIFLRKTEHAIQAYQDKQTQRLPQTEEAKRALYNVMQYEDWEQFCEALNVHRDTVKACFADVIASAPDQSKTDKSPSNPWIPLWQNRLDKDAAVAQLANAGHEAPELSFQIVDELRSWVEQSSMHATSRQRLDIFMPALFARLTEFPQPSETLSRILKLIKSVARRSAYLLLLIENPGALSQLIKLTQASPWIGDKIAEHPALLDELLDTNALYNPPQKSALQIELQRTTLRIAEDDLEGQMEALRYFRSAHVLRVAASEITGALPLMRVSDYLTWIAEVILEHALQLSWREMLTKHGYPDGIETETPNFIIVGYGKLGGIEMGHGSDLDLVFIHDSNANGETNGKRPIDNQTFFMRLGQKIIHFLTTTTASGALYEVDMRLRPSGNSGMLVTSMASFEKYQSESAWTWEHQALVRARVIAGDNKLSQRFAEVRQEILGRHREQNRLRQEVVDMRTKMRNHIETEQRSADSFHLKHDAGGIVDIEFMVQYGVLAWANSHPALATFTDNIRLLESFANSDLLDTHEVRQLTDAYKAFRAAGHRLTLQQQANRVDASQFVDERMNVSAIWTKLMEHGQ